MNNWLKATILLFIPLILIPTLIFTAKKYQTPKQIFKPIPAPITSTPTLTPAPKKTGADLSYIWIYTDEKVSIVVKNDSNMSVGESFIEQPLQDPVSGKLSGSPTKEFLFAKPPSGIYTVTISNPNNQQYKFELYLYGKDGNSKVEKFAENKNVVLQIDYNKQDPNKSVIQKVTK